MKSFLSDIVIQDEGKGSLVVCISMVKLCRECRVEGLKQFLVAIVTNNFLISFHVSTSCFYSFNLIFPVIEISYHVSGATEK